jgi:FkbM family methyltransferase
MISENFDRAFHQGFRIFAVFAALLIIPFVFVVTFLLPLKGWGTHFCILFLVSIFVFWLVKLLWSRNFDRKNSPRLYYFTITIVSMIFVLVLAGFFTTLYLKKPPNSSPLRDLVDTLRNVYHMQQPPPVGLATKPDLIKQLSYDAMRLRFQNLLAFSQKPVRVRFLNHQVGSPSFADLNFLISEIFLQQLYFFKTEREDPFIIDCGSHIGMSILFFKILYPHAKVLGFEPAPHTFAFLKENVDVNNLLDVDVVNKAVSNAEGKMKFFGDDSLTSSLLKSRGGHEIEVDVTKISKYIDRPVDFLKMDVEGAEGLVFEDLVSSGKLNLIKQMIVEYHHHIEKDSDNLSSFLRILEDHHFGYTIESFVRPPFRQRTFQDIMIFAYQK